MKKLRFQELEILENRAGKGIQERSSLKSSRIAKPFERSTSFWSRNLLERNEFGEKSKLAFCLQVTSTVFHPGPIFSLFFSFSIARKLHSRSRPNSCRDILRHFPRILLRYYATCYVYIFREKGVSVARAYKLLTNAVKWDTEREGTWTINGNLSASTDTPIRCRLYPENLDKGNIYRFLL